MSERVQIRPTVPLGGWLLLCAIGVAVFVTVAVGGRAGAADGDGAALLARHAPVLFLRQQSEPCGDGEPFYPIAVDAILGREDVALLDGNGDVITTAPTADDLAGGGEDLAIDLPGEALDPGCAYEKWFDELAAAPAVYGRVLIDGDQVVAQYWMFWIYNDWNDRHEGDWEMIQLGFDASTISEALDSDPAVYAFAQHEGSEYARDGDIATKVRLVDGTRPGVYAAAGSHAAYFSSSQWFGKSGATGFGCDDTRAPLTEVRPDVIPLPDRLPSDGAFAWLSFDGHWGERQPLFNDGPTGPVSKRQWDEPVAWVETEGRDTAVAVPFAGSPPTRAFCALSEAGSMFLLQLLERPVAAIAVLAVAVVVLVTIVRFSSRGILVRTARVWCHDARRLLLVGLGVIAGAIGAGVAQFVVMRWTPVGDAVDVVGTSSPWALPIVTAVGAIVSIPALGWVIAATVTLRAEGVDPGPALVLALRRRGAMFTVVVVVVLVTASFLLFALPIGLFLASRWLVAPVVFVHEDLGVRSSLRRSHRLVRGHGWRSAGLFLTLTLFGALAGAVGAIVLVLTSLGFVVASLLTALVGVVVVPFIALVIVHFYEELSTKAA